MTKRRWLQLLSLPLMALCAAQPLRAADAQAADEPLTLVAAGPSYLGPAPAASTIPKLLRQRLGPDVAQTVECGDLAAGPKAALSLYYLEGKGTFALLRSFAGDAGTVTVDLGPKAKAPEAYAADGSSLPAPTPAGVGQFRVRLGKGPVLLTGLPLSPALRALSGAGTRALAALEAQRAKTKVPPPSGQLSSGISVMAVGSPESRSTGILVEMAEKQALRWVDLHLTEKPEPAPLLRAAHQLYTLFSRALLVLHDGTSPTSHEVSSLQWQANHWLDVAAEGCTTPTGGPAACQWLRLGEQAQRNAGVAQRQRLPNTGLYALRQATVCGMLSAGAGAATEARGKGATPKPVRPAAPKSASAVDAPSVAEDAPGSAPTSAATAPSDGGTDSSAVVSMSSFQLLPGGMSDAQIEKMPGSQENRIALVKASQLTRAGRTAEARATLQKVLERTVGQADTRGLAVRMLREIDMDSALRPGGPCPAIDATDTTGRKRLLEDYKGQVLLLDFWASWGQGSAAHLGQVKAAYDRLRTRDVQVLGVSLDRAPADAAAAAKAAGAGWPQVCDGKVYEAKLYQVFKVATLPSLILIDKTGRVRCTRVDPGKLQSALVTLLSEQ
ncbi:MAG TPA: redoxin domain-containing protein [Armatimonadota bacterium]|jgi:peroxiredoxin